MRQRKLLIAIAALPMGVGLIGCKSPAEYRQESDEVAQRIIVGARSEALGHPTPLAIRPPEEDLRKALLLEQHLAMSTPASLGVRAVDPIPQFPDLEFLEADPDAEPTPPWVARVGEGPMVLTLEESLMVAARNSRDFQDQKDQVFLAALALDLEADEFRSSWAGFLQTEVARDLAGDPQTTVDTEAQLSIARRFTSGMQFTARLGLDLVRLLTGDQVSAIGTIGDASISIPLLRGSGEFVVTEPLKQAQRNVVYQLYSFERFKQTLAVDVASQYLSVLQALDQVRNARQNYENLITSTRRARRLADAGRLPEIQVDQALQDELRARNRWVSAMQSFEQRVDQFKILLGLPTDAQVALDAGELERLAELAQQRLAIEPMALEAEETAPPADAPVVLDPPDPEEAGPLELPYPVAAEIALNQRLDLRVAVGRIDDAQRQVVVAADNLRADLTLLGSMDLSQRRSPGADDDGALRFDEGRYSGLINIDLPLERTAERNLYRRSLVELEQAVRDLQALEDRIKLDVRNALRSLLEAREAVRIQAQAVQVAERRVESTNLFLQAGRAQIRDVLEAQESLVSAQNALTANIVSYRVAELNLQTSLGVLDVSDEMLWDEFDPAEIEADQAVEVIEEDDAVRVIEEDDDAAVIEEIEPAEPGEAE